MWRSAVRRLPRGRSFSATSVVVNYLFLKFFVELCGFWATPSQMMASLGTMVYSYLAAKYFTFRNAVRE